MTQCGTVRNRILPLSGGLSSHNVMFTVVSKATVTMVCSPYRISMFGSGVAVGSVRWTEGDPCR